MHYMCCCPDEPKSGGSARRRQTNQKRKATGRAVERDTGTGCSGFGFVHIPENGVVSSTEKFNINEKALATGHVLIPKEGIREDELVSL